MLCLFESVLTPMEDKIASVHMISNPYAIPKDGLEWLANWVNVSLQEGLAEEKKRRIIQYATILYRKRGTMEGLKLALNLVTDEWVNKGDIVLLEDFRLRRTFATILGADLSIKNDPLFMEDIPSANSFLGETFILGDDTRKEFLLLYSKDFVEAENSMPIVEEFYERFANRLTILVHQHISEEALNLIRRIVSLEVPSHIDYRIVPASKPLLTGLYSLVGVDTYLQEEPKRHVARLGYSYLGQYDFIQKLPVLDDRLEP
jgi:phage tail-like protein